MSTAITELPVGTESIAEMSAHATATGARFYGVRNGADGYAEGGAASGLATLGVDGHVPDSQLPDDLARQSDIKGLARDRNTVTALASTSGTVTVDCSLGDYYTLAVDAEITAWAFENVPAACSLMIKITQGTTAYAVALPTTTLTGDTTAVATAAGAIDMLALTTFDAGTEWIGTLANIASGS
jgi:hypothetical protein